MAYVPVHKRVGLTSFLSHFFLQIFLIIYNEHLLQTKSSMVSVAQRRNIFRTSMCSLSSQILYACHHKRKNRVTKHIIMSYKITYKQKSTSSLKKNLN
jgi:hypothetical protein